MSALLFRLPQSLRQHSRDSDGFSAPAGMERQKYWESKIRSRRDEPFIITIGVKWKCSDVCSWGILTDREIWTLFLHDLINSIRHSPSIFIVQLFDNMKNQRPLPFPIYPREGRGLWCPFQSRIGVSQSLANMLFSHAFLRSWFDILVS